MTDTTIVERDVIAPVEVESGGSPLSWSAAIAGAVAATAVTLMIIALGAGIGLSFASPYSGPSATTMTVAAAVWLVMAQAMGFASGGYLAGRLRSPASDGVIGETAFRDGAQGFVVWAIGVVAMAVIAGVVGLYSVGAASQAAAGAAQVAAQASAPARFAPTDYFVDLLFRPGTTGSTVGGAASPVTLDPEIRAQVTRVMVRGVAQTRLDDNDRIYLAQLISSQARVAPEEAERRVAEVETKARAAVKESANKAATAGAMFSFWTFMSLLFGATCATLAGILGGQLRDDEGRVESGLAEVR